ncbi:MAG: polysaccharide deacetylase family protein [Candidatus Levyibacteriota bacterium]|nr:MAG: polysaccharide deacetylase family protein [Candidatus Levybacteria bacterium]
MKKKKTSRKKKKFSKKLLLIPFFFLFVLFSFSAFARWQFSEIVESRKTDMAKLPKGVKAVLSASSSAAFRVPILMYHYIEYVKDKNDTIRQSLTISPRVFDLQIKTLKDDGYTFMTVSELAIVLDGKRELPQKPILLTIDDGHWDLYTDILPILKKYHVKATAYIISGLIGGSDFLSKEQLEKVIQSGLVEIGAHTVHHVGLAYKLLPVAEYEVKTSKKQLEETYQIPVVSFAYPGGSFDVQAENVVKEAGFSLALSTIPGIKQSQENRFFLYRIRPGYRTGKDLLTYLQQDRFRPW